MQSFKSHIIRDLCWCFFSPSSWKQLNLLISQRLTERIYISHLLSKACVPNVNFNRRRDIYFRVYILIKNHIFKMLYCQTNKQTNNQQWWAREWQRKKAMRERAKQNGECLLLAPNNFWTLFHQNKFRSAAHNSMLTHSHSHRNNRILLCSPHA